MSCQCTTCLPNCGFPNPALCPDKCSSGTAIKVVDENCTERILSGAGLAYSDGDSVYHTDGSSDLGAITLKPESSNGVDALFGRTSNGTLIEIGDESPDGSSIFKEAGQWKAGTRTDEKTIYESGKVGEFSDSIAAWGCGANGTIRLGKFPNCPESIIYMGTDGRPVCITMDQLAVKLFASLCSQAPEWTNGDCITGLMVCTADGLKKVKPVSGKYLIGDKNNAACWKMSDINTLEEGISALKLVFKYTGATQYFTVPADVAFMTVKVWGAGGTADYQTPYNLCRGGVGGYSYIKYPVIAGQVYAVVVGRGGEMVWDGSAIYGFGGRASSDQHQSNGGGLTGVFKNATEVSVNERDRAIVIAGGGGGGGASNYNQNLRVGGNGNAVTGLGTMQGANATDGQFAGLGAGGGGYAGGQQATLYGFGGTGYVSPLGVGGTQFASFTATSEEDPPPNSTDIDYDTGYQAGRSNRPGLTVVSFSVN